MQGAVVGRKRGRQPSLRVFVVDDHCDALSKIHGAIRRGALPFAGLSFLHFDAHPDLMVTPDMPAETCFRPQELYHTLATAEGGIAEWILPLVYQVSHRQTLLHPRFFLLVRGELVTVNTTTTGSRLKMLCAYCQREITWIYSTSLQASKLIRFLRSSRYPRDICRSCGGSGRRGRDSSLTETIGKDPSSLFPD